METGTSIDVILLQGERVAGRLVWYDQECLKVAPADGSPSLLIPKISIKYLHETVIRQADPPDEFQSRETAPDQDPPPTG